jgi:hypothetical protein
VELPCRSQCKPANEPLKGGRNYRVSILNPDIYLIFIP